MKKIRHFVAAAVAAATFFLGASSSAAGVIDSTDVAGLRTFRDTDTGRIWLDLNNFYDASANSSYTAFGMVVAAQAAGFTVATAADLLPLLGNLPLDGAGVAWSVYANIMGATTPRYVIWGAYNDGTLSDMGWGYASIAETGWTVQPNTIDPLLVADGNAPGAQDLGLWAYLDDPTFAAPEPGSLVLIGTGVAGLLAVRRRSRKTPGSPVRSTRSTRSCWPLPCCCPPRGVEKTWASRINHETLLVYSQEAASWSGRSDWKRNPGGVR